MPDSSKRESRSRILEALTRELMGPTSLDETITEFPTTRYIVGRLAPLDTEIPEIENDQFAAGSDDDEGPSSGHASKSTAATTSASTTRSATRAG